MSLVAVALRAEAIDIVASLRSAPSASIRTRSANSFQWVEYCPDETCDVLRTRKPIRREELSGIGLAYFALASDYGYLGDWQENPTIQEAAFTFLESQGIRDCGGASRRARAQCILKRLGERHALEILFIRHDEGGTSILTRPLSRVIE